MQARSSRRRRPYAQRMLVRADKRACTSASWASSHAPLIALALLIALVLSAGRPATLHAQTAYVTRTFSDLVTPIDTTTNIAGPPIVVGSAPVGVAITPDGRTAYVANFNSNSVTPIDTATNTVGPAIATLPGPEGIAITPDGKTAYVTSRLANAVVPIDTATNTAGAPVPVGSEPFAIAIAPDGRTLYVGDEGDSSISAIDIATNTVVATISLGGPTASIAIVPDGRTAYAVGFAGAVTPIDLATNTASATFSAGSTSFGIAIAPDGATAYVVNEFSGTVTPFLTASNTALSPIPLTTFAVADAVTPDGKTLYVTNAGTGPGLTDAVTAISTATNAPEGPPIAIGELTFEVAITPAQAPTAAFAAQAGGAGQPTHFDASASSASHGSIATYRWEFGDGTIESTASATTSHTYAAPGTYPARLTVTDGEGCSTAFVFTGQTASCTGSSRASAAEPVTVAASQAPALLQRALVAPLISGLRARSKCVSHASLAGAPSSGAGGLAFSYTLNEQASVLYVVKRRDGSPGRRTCAPASGREPGNYTDVGGVVGPGAAGANGVSLGSAARSPAGRRRAGRTMRLHLMRPGLAVGRHDVTLAQLAQGKQLASGTYVLLARATNAAGQHSNDAMVKFFVTR
jgi:YVTN family beta-propeller protein